MINSRPQSKNAPRRATLWSSQELKGSISAKVARRAPRRSGARSIASMSGSDVTPPLTVRRSSGSRRSRSSPAGLEGAEAPERAEGLAGDRPARSASVFPAAPVTAHREGQGPALSRRRARDQRELSVRVLNPWSSGRTASR
jgi:hypothetical protein